MEENNNNYQNISILNQMILYHLYYYQKKKSINLFSSSKNTFQYLNNFEFIYEIKYTCCEDDYICRLDDDKIFFKE